ncbi:MAG: DUF29 domain-containing protein [Leptolyngbya sp. Prado105]|jgi:hypothetical protein|nr:DUF29 domain-containing protein [Leptolyngbya sp. Prado105]
MNADVKAKLDSLYDTDYQRWIHQTVAQLKAQDFGKLDLENLIEEIESLGKQDKRSLSSDLTRLCEHLLKIKHWEPERERCLKGWISEVTNFRSEIELILEDSPSLKPFLSEIFLSCYQRARKNVLKVVELSSDSISEEPSFTLEQTLDEDWLL